MGTVSKDEADLIRKNKLLMEAMTGKLNQTMLTTMNEMMKANLKEIH